MTQKPKHVGDNLWEARAYWPQSNLKLLAQCLAGGVTRIKRQCLLHGPLSLLLVPRRKLRFAEPVQQLGAWRAVLQGQREGVGGVRRSIEGLEGEPLQIQHLLRLFPRAIRVAQRD